jgi:3-keto-5-aminohexanoate cleavage enzyme
MSSPVILTCAIVGAELTREDYPSLPLSPEELAEAAREACEAGASIIHLHVRDAEGLPSQSVEIFEETTAKIKNRCDCILQYSTGGAVGTPLKERKAPLGLQPEMATLSMGTMNFGASVFENSEQIICGLAQEMQAQGVMPELEIFDYGMMDTAIRYLKKGYIPDKFHVDFVLGVPGGMNGSLKSLILLQECLPPLQTWTVAGVGRHQLSLGVLALALGGHVRVGLEDNVYYRKGELASSNAQLVARMARIAKEMDRSPATVTEARKILGLVAPC